MDYRTLDFSLSDLRTRDTDDDSMKISGYAALYNQPSQPLPFIEYIRKGAFDNVDLSDVLLLYGHEPNQILARTNAGSLSLKLDDKGLFFTASLPDTTLGHDTYNNILAGNLRGCSFGFTIATGGDAWSQGDDGKVIHDVTQIESLAEISITPIPAYNETSVQVQRSLDKFEKEGEQTMSTETKVDKKAAEDSLNNFEGLTRALTQAFTEALNRSKGTDPKSAQKRDDDDEPLETDAKSEPTKKRDYNDEPLETDDTSAGNDDKKSAKTGSKSNNSTDSSDSSDQGSDNSTSDENANTSDDNPSSTDSSESGNDGSNPTKIANDKKKEGNVKMRSLSNEAKEDKLVQFREFLQTGKATRDLAPSEANQMGLSDGSVIIPQDILNAEHEVHQFPRLGNMVRTISVKHTTGKLPVFQTSDDVLKLHTEYTETPANKKPQIKTINWDLKTYTGRYIFSQDLISDSDYNWQGELQSRLVELRDNTNDSLIIDALTKNITPVKVAAGNGIVNQLKDALDKNLKPIDSRNAGIVMSQSAYAQLDEMEDNEGRPLVQPNLVQGTGSMVLGKSIAVVDDTLFPGAKAGDVNVIITPFQKAVISFKNNEITGQFQDTYDIWYKQLGIYLRQDVVQARPDLINWISGTTGAKAAASTDK